MATWSSIPDENLDPDKPIRSVDGLALRDNPIAIAEGASGAPKINGSQGTVITSQNAMGSGIVGRSQMITATASTSGSLGSNLNVNITLNRMSFFPMIGETHVLRMSAHSSASGATSPRFSLYNGNPAPVDYDVRHEYIDA